MDTFIVRRAVSADLLRVVPLFDAYRQFYAKPSDLVAAQALLDAGVRRSEVIVFIAGEGENASVDILGFILVYPSFSSVAAAHMWVLNDLYVAAEGRRRGVGRALVRYVLREAARSGAHHVELATQAGNASARALYEAEGFELDA